ncbi:hypothetical protein LP420_39900 [Massilia sp. B-10]|nr:hypothetical protein LP420_39900 [Massilia sp. B-10]
MSVVAVLVAGWMFGVAPAGAASGAPKGAPVGAKAAKAQVQKQPAATREAEQRTILERIAMLLRRRARHRPVPQGPRRQRQPASRPQRGTASAAGSGTVPARRAAAAAETVERIGRPAGTSLACLSQGWRAAVLVHEGHQQAVEARLTKADGGAAYLAKFRAVAGQRKGQQEQLSKLVDAIVGAEPTAPEEARTVNPASVRAALALLDAKRRGLRRSRYCAPWACLLAA